MDVKFFHFHSHHILDNLSIDRLSSKQQSVGICETSNKSQNGKHNEIKGESRLEVVFIYHERLLDIWGDQRMHIIMCPKLKDPFRSLLKQGCYQKKQKHFDPHCLQVFFVIFNDVF